MSYSEPLSPNRKRLSCNNAICALRGVSDVYAVLVAAYEEVQQACFESAQQVGDGHSKCSLLCA